MGRDRTGMYILSRARRRKRRQQLMVKRFTVIALFFVLLLICIRFANIFSQVIPLQEKLSLHRLQDMVSDKLGSKVIDKHNRDDNFDVQKGTSSSIEDWKLVLVNRDNSLVDGYVPQLEKVDRRGHSFDKRAADELKKMLNAAKKAGLSPIICSSYRTWDKQIALFNREVEKRKNGGLSKEEATEKAKEAVAYPGTSEHQLGLAVDIVALDYQVLDEKQAQTREAKWLREHCIEYGFILRYPEDKSEITGVIFEPWHFRYVGKEAAKIIMDRGICLEEYLEEFLGK